MATFVVAERYQTQVGSKRMITLVGAFDGTSATTVDTGLAHIDGARVTVADGTTDDVFSTYRNTTTTTDDAGDAPGTLNFAGIAATAYVIRVVGV
jgi:hypothetical protein